MTGMTVTTMTDDGVPVFGANADLEGTVQFELEALHVPTGRRERHRFTAWKDPGPDFVLAFIRSSQDDAAAMNAAAVLLTRGLLDHDGLPSTAVKTDDGPWTDEVDDWSSKRRFLHLAESDDYRVAAMAIVDVAQFLVREAFQRGGTPVAGAGGSVPTAAPSRSQRGRTTKPRGSTAKPPRKAST
jgi:hypothetical protein